MDSKEIGKIIRSKREELGFTQDHVAMVAGISKPYLSNIETGRTKNPPTDTLLGSLEKALRFAPGELVALAHFARTPSDVREAHEQKIAELDCLRNVLRKFMNAELQNGQKLDARAIEQLARNSARNDRSDAFGLAQVGRAIPIINGVGAGYPPNFSDPDCPAGVADDYVRCPDVRDAQAFAVRVFGDSMSPVYNADDIIVFSPNTPARGGDDCFVRFGDGSTTFARVYFDSETTIRLQPLNPRHPAQVLTRDQVTNFWPAVWRMVRLRRTGG